MNALKHLNQNILSGLPVTRMAKRIIISAILLFFLVNYNFSQTGFGKFEIGIGLDFVSPSGESYNIVNEVEWPSMFTNMQPGTSIDFYINYYLTNNLLGGIKTAFFNLNDWELDYSILFRDSFFSMTSVSPVLSYRLPVLKINSYPIISISVEGGPSFTQGRIIYNENVKELVPGIGFIIGSDLVINPGKSISLSLGAGYASYKITPEFNSDREVKYFTIGAKISFKLLKEKHLYLY